MGKTAPILLAIVAAAVATLSLAQTPPPGQAPAVQAPAAAGAAPGGAPGGRGGAPAAQAGPKLPIPTVFPLPGTYSNTTGLTLMDAEPGVALHYSWDGSNPTATSPVYDPKNPIFLTGLYDGDKGLSTGYTLRVLATKAGAANSDIATFAYQVQRRDRTAYVSEIVAPGVRMIRDSDNDKMYLVQGTKAYALIDSGQGRGALKDYLSQFTGGLPIIPIWTHSHPDHIGQAEQFISSVEYVGTPDRAAVASSITRKNIPAAQVDANLKGLDDGGTVDLGDRSLVVYLVPGHTPGSIVIFDPKTGNLYSGDAFGNNSFLPPDVMWMQMDNRPLDEYYAAVKTVRAKLNDKIKLIFTGHNDRPIIGTTYLDNLETAMQNMMDRGDAALVPSFRPPGIMQEVVGDMMTDPNWFGVNINQRAYLPAPVDQIDSLVGLTVTGAALSQSLNPRNFDYDAVMAGPPTAPVTVTLAAIPTSTRAKSVTIDGQSAQPGRPATLRITGAGRSVPIVVTAPDGTTVATYHVNFKRPS